VPKNSKPTESTLNASSFNSTVMATAKVGNGSSGPVANGSGELAIRSCCGRLFHKVGGSKTTREHQSNNNSEVLLAEHSLQIWGS
jgi:hypothetical protein